MEAILVITVVGVIILPIIVFIVGCIWGTGSSTYTPHHGPLVEPWYMYPPTETGPVAPPPTNITVESKGITIEDMALHEAMDAIWKG